MTRKLLSLLPVLAALTGCAVAYVAPAPSSTTARFRITEPNGVNTDLHKLHNACIVPGKTPVVATHYEKIANFSAVSDGSDFRRLNMPDPPAESTTKFTEIVVDATKPFHFGYGAFALRRDALGYTTFNCVNGMSFQPLAGNDYEAVITRQGFESCGLHLFQLKEVSGAFQRVPVASAKHIRDTCK